MAILITNKFPKYINLTASSVKSIISQFLTWGQSIPARFWGTETPEYWGGIDAQAQAHYDRVIADGGVLPSGLGGVNAFFQVVKNIYATSDITTAISVGLDAQVLGYKLGAGAGTTLGQAAQKLYSCSGASGDVVQTTAASQPLLLVHSGENYYFQSGTTGNFLTTPNAAQNQLIGTVDIDASFEVQSNNNFSAGKVLTNASGTSYAINMNGTNIRYGDSTGTFTIIANISSFLPSNGTRFWIRILHIGIEATAYTSIDGVNWIARGSNTVAPLISSYLIKKLFIILSISLHFSHDCFDFAVFSSKSSQLNSVNPPFFFDWSAGKSVAIPFCFKKKRFKQSFLICLGAIYK
jgi:hypothetical protein